jgi:hypothetical protein
MDYDLTDIPIQDRGRDHGPEVLDLWMQAIEWHLECWRRLRDWQRAGVWDLMHFALLDCLARSDQIDWSRAVVDSCSVRASAAVTRPVQIPLIGPSAGARVI